MRLPREANATGSSRGRLGLNARELEALSPVADGDSNIRIGQRLFGSPKTASVHVSRTLARLGVPSRSAATSLVVREEGLLDDNTPT
jgi:DNA-binding CsgD family transcriptional regulator